MASAAPPPATKKKTVLVTGANGYLASHIVKQLLDKGHDVRACVRDASNVPSVDHLLRMMMMTPSSPPSSSSSSSSSTTTTGGRLELYSTGDIGDPSLCGRYDGPLRGCDAVIHAATPLSPKLAGNMEFGGVRDMLEPGMAGTREILDSIIKCPSVRCLVLTSSMSAAAPVPEPLVKDESHWSDGDAQLSRGSFYGCLKTRQERLCHEWTRERKEGGELPVDFRFVAICPTMILGPPVLFAGTIGSQEDEGCATTYAPTGTMGSLHRWITGGRRTAPNDSMSFVHVRDCAAMHVKAVESADIAASASGRYFSLVESWHWNRILTELKDLYPAIELEESFEYEGEDIITPTRFNLERMNTLGVKVASIREILAESVDFFIDVGALK